MSGFASKTGGVRKGSRIFKTGKSTGTSLSSGVNMNELRKISTEPSDVHSNGSSSGVYLELGGLKAKGESIQDTESLLAYGVQVGKSTTLGSKHDLNEDRACYDVFEYEGHVYCFAAVMDGHGGHSCSDYLSHVMAKHIRASFCKEDAWEDGEQVLTNTFHEIDRQFCDRAVKLQDYSGACATVVICRDDEAIVGNIGDCRSVLVPLDQKGGYGSEVEITVDHRATAAAETTRINEAGGRIKDGRVMTLEPSRSFGDVDVKLAAGKDVVIAEPDVDRIVIKSGASRVKKKAPQKRLSKSFFDGPRAFLIIATDGVWDVLDNKTASQCVKSTLNKLSGNILKNPLGSILNSRRRNSKSSDGSEVRSDAEMCADSLVKLAVQKGSDDDVTVIVILF